MNWGRKYLNSYVLGFVASAAVAGFPPRLPLEGSEWWGCHNPRWGERHNEGSSYRTPTSLDTSVISDILPGTANIGCKIFRGPHYRWGRHCKELNKIGIISCRWKTTGQRHSRCFWHPSTFSGQSQLWAFSLYSRPPIHNCSVAVPFQQVQYRVQLVSCPKIPYSQSQFSVEIGPLANSLPSQ